MKYLKFIKMQEFLLNIINHENENSQYTRKYKALIEKAKLSSDINIIDLSKIEALSNAFDNMSRKQRMDFIKRTKENKESFNKSSKNIKKSLDEKSDILASDLYKAGLSKHSKTLEKTLDSIEKEKKYFNY